MAQRKGVAILREITLVQGSGQPDEIKAAMLKELNDELAALYAPAAPRPPDLVDAMQKAKPSK